MKKFCESLIERAIDIINFKKKKNVTNKSTTEIILNANIYYIYKEKCEEKHTKYKNYH